MFDSSSALNVCSFVCLTAEVLQIGVIVEWRILCVFDDRSASYVCNCVCLPVGENQVCVIVCVGRQECVKCV